MQMFLRNFSIYFFGRVIYNLLPIVLLPIITSLLTTSEYGIMGQYTMFQSFIYPIVSVSMTTLFVRYYHDSNERKLQDVMATLIPLTALIAAILVILCLVAGGFYDTFKLGVNWMFLLPLSAWFMIFPELYFSFLQQSEQPFKYVLMQLLYSLATFVITYILLMLNPVWLSRIFGSLSANLLFTVLGLRLLKGYKIRLSGIQVNVVREGASYILVAIIGLIMPLFLRLLIEFRLGLSELGTFTLVFQLGSFMSIPVIAFNSYYAPLVFKRLNNGTFALDVSIRETAYYLVGLILIGFAYIIFLPWIMDVLITGQVFKIGAIEVLPIVVYFILLGITFNTTHVLIHSQKGTFQSLSLSLCFVIVGGVMLVFEPLLSHYLWAMVIFQALVLSIYGIRCYRLLVYGK